MIESYLAPADLPAARRRVEDAAAARCRAAGLDPAAGAAVVRLRSGPVERSLATITQDTVCVVSDLKLWRLSPTELGALAGALQPDRSLLFLEPTADFGWRRAVHRMTRRLWRIGLRHNFEADVPASLRAAGLVVTTADRFGLGPQGIRSYVWGEARHYKDK